MRNKLTRLVVSPAFIVSVSLFLAAAVRAKDIYVAQNSAGADTGADVANAHSLSWLNTAANWGGGTNQVSPGDIVHLSGTLTSTLMIQASGTPGNITTIVFELNAKLSSPAWGTGTLSAIYMPANSAYISIDGGTNGKIENTDNGTTLSHQQQSVGILGFGGLSHVTVKNMTVATMYVRTFNSSTDTNRCGDGIDLTGSYLTIQNNTLSNLETGINWSVTSSDSGNETITGNTVSKCNHAFQFSASSSSINASNFTFSNNTITMDPTWDGVSGNHLDGLIWQDENPPRGAVANVNIYGNTVTMSASQFNTAALFFNTYFNAQISNLNVYNNLFVCAGSGKWSNGDIYLGAATTALVASNTAYALIPYASGGPGGFFMVGGNSTGNSIPSALTIKNNLVINKTFGISFSSAPSGSFTGSNFVCDNNAYYNLTLAQGGTFIVPGNHQYTTADWSGLGYDTHSTFITLPLLDANYVPTSLDVAARGKGANLSSYFTTDKNGNTRPSSGAWDIGAFQSPAGSSPPKSPTGLHTLP